MTEYNDPFQDDVLHDDEVGYVGGGDDSEWVLTSGLDNDQESADDPASVDPLGSDPFAAFADPEFDQWLAEDDQPEAPDVAHSNADPETIGALSDPELDAWLGNALRTTPDGHSADQEMIRSVLDRHQKSDREL